MLIEHRSASLSFLITWIATNLSVRVPFRDNIYCVFIRLFTNTVIISIYSYCHNKGILSLPHGLYQQSNESNSVRWFDLLSPIITATITVPQCYLKVTTRAGWRICHLSKTQHIWVFFYRCLTFWDNTGFGFLNSSSWITVQKSIFIRRSTHYTVRPHVVAQNQIWQRILQDITYTDRRRRGYNGRKRDSSDRFRSDME